MCELKSSCNAIWHVFWMVLIIVGTALGLTNYCGSCDKWVHMAFIALACVAVIQSMLYIEQYEANDSGVIRKSILGNNTINWNEVQDAYYIYYDCAKSVTVECVVLVNERNKKRVGYHRAMILVLKKKLQYSLYPVKRIEEEPLFLFLKKMNWCH